MIGLGDSACPSRGAGVLQAFAVLRMMPPFGAVTSPAAIKVRLEGIPGVRAVRVDADRGKIHLLYDGTAAAMEMARSVVAAPGAFPDAHQAGHISPSGIPAASAG